MVGPVVFVTVDQGTQLVFGQPVVGGVVEGVTSMAPPSPPSSPSWSMKSTRWCQAWRAVKQVRTRTIPPPSQWIAGGVDGRLVGRGAGAGVVGCRQGGVGAALLL